MITNTEFNISNQTYTKKDFYQVYPEILDLVQKITNIWDPASSNESDPGVVLLKLLAFIADKNNYNIDKNVLECFMPSCTQEESMRKLCDMMGYSMKYHQSATTTISFMYQGSELPKDAGDTTDSKHSNYIYLPAFSTVVCNVDGDINYVLTQSVTLDQKYDEKSAIAIEGTYCEVQVGSSSTENVLKLNNLDDNLRFYLPETQIAENGIWVRHKDNPSYDTWKRVDNLNTQVAGSKVFKFGFDSKKKLPYIQFPNDIAELIDEGLQVSYVRTSGINGNVSKKVLTQLANATEVILVDHGTETTTPISDNENTYLVLSNLVAATNGRDAETLDEAYNGFKKTVSTFDTLVTCRDYANKIYQLVSEKDNTTPLVSNAIVADIRDDLNNSYKIMTFNNFGICYEDVAKSSGGTALIDHFTLRMYPFKNITGGYTSDTFQDSFRYGTNNVTEIKDQLEDYKTIAHKIETPNSASATEVFCIKNYYGLNAKITTTYKVNKAEEKLILENVYKALYKAFNCRQVDFGEELVYDEILKTIEEADVRIKNVTLDDPEIETWVMAANGNETALISSGTGSSQYEDFVVKNILAGRLNLLKRLDKFTFDYGMVNTGSGTYNQLIHGKGFTSAVAPEDEITSLDATFGPTISTTARTLLGGEAIDFIAPNLIDKYIYPAYVNYRFVSQAHATTPIQANHSYQFVSGDTLYTNYTDSSSVVHNIKYECSGLLNSCTISKWEDGTLVSQEAVDRIIIKPNFELYQSTTPWTKTSGFPAAWGWGDNDGMKTLDTTEQITMQDYNISTLNTTTLFYWYTKTGYIPMPTTGTMEYILQDGEYLFYTNTAKTELITLGPGTRVFTNNQTTASKFASTHFDHIDMTEYAEQGLAAFADVPWAVFQLTGIINYVQLWEMQTISLAAKDIINSIDPAGSATSITLSAAWQAIDGANYTLYGGTAIDLPTAPSGSTWLCRSRLSLDIGPDQSQVLYDNEQVALKNTTGTTTTTIATLSGSSTTLPQVRTNYLFQTAGGTNISTKRYTTDNVEVNDLLFLHHVTKPVLDQGGTDISNLLHQYNEKYSKFGAGLTTIKLPLPYINSYQYIVMIHVEFGTSATNTVTAHLYQPGTTTGVNAIDWYNPASASAAASVTLHAGINVIKVSNAATSAATTPTDLVITKNTADVVIVSDLQVTSTTNNGVDSTTLGLNSTGVTNVLTNIRTAATIGSNDVFYYNAEIDPAMLIDTGTEGTMKDPLVWYDYNNVCNKFVVSELDVGSFSNITLTKASRQ